MFIKRTKFDEIQKRLAEYRDSNYGLELENETLREYKDSYDYAKAEFEMDIRYMKNVAEIGKVVRKDGKALVELWLKRETLKRLIMLAHKQPEAFLSRDEEIASYIEKLIEGTKEE